MPRAALVVPAPSRPNDVGTPGPERFRSRRDDTRARYDAAMADRARWTRATFVAKQLRTALENPGRPFDPYILSRKEAADEFRRLHPQATKLLGDAVVAAATPEKSACRWCHGVAYARVHQVPLPDRTSAAVRSLLGRPCAHPASLRGQMDAVLAKVAPYRREVQARARKATFNSLIASGTITARDAKGRPTRLRANLPCPSCGGPACSGCQIVHPTETPFPTEFPQQTATMTLAPRVRWR
jgi:hypothetical protein